MSKIVMILILVCASAKERAMPGLDRINQISDSPDN